MKKAITLIIILFFSGTLYAQGSIIQTSFISKSLGFNRNVNIYLPDGYNPNDTIRYPVIYFLHGATQNHNSMSGILLNILDSLIGNQTIQPLIMVFPDGSMGPFEGSCWTNSDLYGKFEDYTIYDLVEFIDNVCIETKDKTFPVREKRCIMGVSMGGYGCMKLAVKHPNIYTGVASLCGPLDFATSFFSTAYIDVVKNEHSGGAPYTYKYDFGTHPLTSVMYTWAGACSPNLSNSPPVDFPLDSNANLIPSVVARWVPHDVTNLAASLTPNDELSIYFDCGTTDQFFFFPSNQAFEALLKQLGIQHTFYSFIGGHTSFIIDRCQRAVKFLGEEIRNTTLVSETDKISAITGGEVTFYLTADLDNANRNYIMLGSVSGTIPGTPLPGGMATLPLNWDVFTSLIIDLINTPIFSNFMGQLDGMGSAVAIFDTLAPIPGTVGLTLYFAYALNNPWDFVSNPVGIEIVP